MGNLALLAPPTNRFVLVSGLVAAAGTATALLLQDQPWTLRGDNANQILPLIFAAYDQWMHGAVPGWGTRMWSGHFLVAEPIAGSFYPPHWISFWLTPSPHLRALDVDAALHMGILVSGIVALLARLGVPRLGALVAAALVASMPPTLGWMFFEFRFAGIVWLPWALLGAECLCDPGARVGRQVLLGSMAVAAPFLAGSPETFLQSALIVGVWLLTRASGLPLAARLLRGTALALATLLLISPQLIPTALSVPASTRSEVPVLQALGGVPIDGLGALIAPASAGAVSAVGSPYLGAACLGLALIALFARARCTFILAGVGLASLLISMGTATPLYGWLTQVPPFNLFQNPWKYYPPAAHAITLMAGMGIGVLCRWGRRGVWPALALAALALVERAVVLPAILSGPFIMPPNPPDVTALESVLPELVGSAGSDEPAPRVFVDDHPFVLGNLPTVYGVELVAASHTPLMSARHVSFGMTKPDFQPGMSQAQLDLLGIDLIFSPAPCRTPRWPRVEKLLSTEKACVYRNLTSGPRLELLRTPRIVTDIDELIRVSREAPDGAIPILVEAHSQPPPNIISSDEGGVHMTRYERGRIRAEVQSPSPAWLLLRESASPGWRVTVDGKDTSVHPAAGIFFAIPVPAGRHDVEFRFAPPGRLAGMLGALAWLLLGVGLARIDFPTPREQRD